MKFLRNLPVTFLNSIQHRFLLFLLGPVLFCGISCLFLLKPKENIEMSNRLTPPDYSDLKDWASHPDKIDPADDVPKNSGFVDRQSEAKADVFFIHPTTLIIGGKYWNADIAGESLNNKTDKGPIRSQASAFNDCCKIYAPRYRQATFYVFVEETPQGKEAIDFAYADVKKAFLYYLKNLNKGRPWILASHSQGTRHASRLLREVISPSDIKNNLIAAYAIGFPYRAEEVGLPACESPESTGCVINWNSYKWGKTPNRLVDRFRTSLCMNPLTWTNDEKHAAKELNLGSLPINFDRILPAIADAKCNEGILWVHDPDSRGFPAIGKDDTYHLVDYHLFYSNIRQNAKARVEKFLSLTSGAK
ncbi:PF11288 family protein [Leptospira broomii serovar Hurstbridge str. 5399]|uniref:PF11288 family protein n=2 Tax=Leptospira broomii TaxID=301541 RepID=T0GNG6_9LEPT|nr:PF11288 family protein [Leptospira broomii serovar Hurstbridge str. 5399]